MKRTPLRRKKGVPRRSKKRIARDKIYAATRQAVHERDEHCLYEREMMGCYVAAVVCDVHHILSGGGDALDNLVTLCRRHHTWVHANRRKAEAMGLRKSSVRVDDVRTQDDKDDDGGELEQG